MHNRNKEHTLNGILAAINSMNESMRSITSITADFQKRLDEVIKPIRDFSTGISNIPLLQTIRRFSELIGYDGALNKSGWLPHHTTPETITSLTCPETIHQELSSFYADQWPEVRKALKQNILQYTLDEESIAVFNEALAAHEAGMYRSVCRLVFPEIERLNRKKFSPGTYKGMASVPELQNILEELPIDHLRRDTAAPFLKLMDHLYKKIKTEEDISVIEPDGVPNRHACVHGLIIYDTMQNSLNSIFMLEYIFGIFDYINHLKPALYDNVQIEKSATTA